MTHRNHLLRRAAGIGILTAIAVATPCPAVDHGETRPSGAPPLKVAERIAGEGDLQIVRFTNGLTAIVQPTRTVPVVCVRAYVRTGGLYEGRWLGAGISHLTEHLVAKGAVHDMGPAATADEAKQTSDRVEQIGGQSNAYTSLDHTCYYISATAGKTMDCIDLVADWMARPEILAQDFEREHGVVQRELELGKDDPDRQMWYAHQRNVFRDHPAGVPVIGFARPLAELTWQDVLDYHAKMYVPQNMVFAVTGDVDADAVIERLADALSGFRAGREPELTLPEVQTFTGVRRAVVADENVTEAVENLSFQTIPLIHPDLYALDVLSYVLTRGESSRLDRKLKRDARLVTGITSSSWTPAWGTGIFTFRFRGEPDRMDAAEAMLLDELRAVVADGVTADELDRAKRQKVADYVYARQTVESRGASLATDFLSTGDVAFSRNYTDRIQAVTAEEVHAAARKYFDFDAMVVTRMVPVGSPVAAAPATQPAARRDDAPDDEAAILFTLDNGLRVVLRPTEDVGLVSMAFASKGGLLLEGDQTNGLGTLMTALSTRGAGDRAAEQIDAFFDRAGGGLSGDCGNNTFYWQATVLSDAAPEAMDILADVIVRPTFPADELDILRPLALARIARNDEELIGQLMKFFRASFFAESPYSMLSDGRRNVVADATAERIARWQREHVRAGSSVLAVYGEFDAADARKRIAAGFADLPAGDVELPDPPPPSVPDDGERVRLTTDKQGAGVIVAVGGMKLSNVDDRLAINVLDTLISGYNLPAGPLHARLRGGRLVYVVHAYNWAGLAPGAFLVYAACQPEQADKVIDIIHEELRRAADREPTQQEIDRAVNTILTAELLNKQAMSDLAMSAALDELYGFGYDFRDRLRELYGKITPADVRRVGRKYLSGGYFTVLTTPRED